MCVCVCVVIDGWMDDAILCLFNSFSVISGRWADDNERLCAMEPRLWLGRWVGCVGVFPIVMSLHHPYISLYRYICKCRKLHYYLFIYVFIYCTVGLAQTDFAGTYLHRCIKLDG